LRYWRKRNFCSQSNEIMCDSTPSWGIKCFFYEEALQGMMTGVWECSFWLSVLFNLMFRISIDFNNNSFTRHESFGAIKVDGILKLCFWWWLSPPKLKMTSKLFFKSSQPQTLSTTVVRLKTSMKANYAY
jgi:hypothetical protein